MKKLTFAQGKLLIKLVNRECNQSSYQLVKAFMGPFKAGFYQAFAALFGTPMAAALFPMEVISVGIMYYAALVPCMFSAFIGERISIFMGVRTLTAPYPVEEVPDFTESRGEKRFFWQSVLHLSERCSV